MAEKPELKKELRVQEISDITKQNLLNKSAFSLPDNPAMRGMKPNEIKKYLYSAIIDYDDKFISKHPSVIGIIERLISDTNDAFSNSSDYLEEVIAYIEYKIREQETNFEEELNTAKTELQEQISNVSSAVQEVSEKVEEQKELNSQQSESIQANAKSIENNAVEITKLWDAGYITKFVNDLENYYLKSETYSKAEINEMHEVLAGLGIEFEVVQTLPTTGNNKTIYLLSAKDSQDQDIYEEYIYIRGAWERIGSTAVNLANYYTKLQIDALLKNYAPKHWEGTRQEFEQAQDSIAVGTICIITESNGDVTIETKTAILGKAVLGEMILGNGE